MHKLRGELIEQQKCHLKIPSSFGHRLVGVIMPNHVETEHDTFTSCICGILTTLLGG